MKKYGVVSVSILSAALTSLFLGATVALAATSLGSYVQTNANMNSGVSSVVNANVGVGTNANVNSASGTAASEGTTVTASSGVSSVSGSNSGNAAINASINIASGQPGLTTYAQSIAANDPSISAVSADNSNVSISYRVPVRLFGFIPVSETETATVNTSSSGTPQVSVHRSWWSFLAAGNNSSATAVFSSAVNARLNASVSDSSQAQIMSDIESAAQQSSVSGSATAATDASASTGY